MKPLTASFPHLLRNIGDTLWDALFPPRCIGCGRGGYTFCPECWPRVETLPENVCPRCAHPLPPHATTCPHCTSGWWLAQARAVRPYTGLWRKAIHALKYRRNKTLARLFEAEAAETMQRVRWPVSCLVPIPLHPQRLRERGYNQVHLWAAGLARRLRMPYRPQGLERVRPTPSQVHLSREERWANVQGAFQARPQAVWGCRVLLVDDVLTTGATLNEAARTLLQAGAVAVYGLVLARAVFVSESEADTSGHQRPAQAIG